MNKPYPLPVAPHPESQCDKCGGRNVTWFTDSALWNECHGDYDILCPLCFVELAEVKGHNKEAWKLAPEFEQPEAAEPGQRLSALLHSMASIETNNEKKFQLDAAAFLAEKLEAAPDALAKEKSGASK